MWQRWKLYDGVWKSHETSGCEEWEMERKIEDVNVLYLCLSELWGDEEGKGGIEKMERYRLWSECTILEQNISGVGQTKVMTKSKVNKEVCGWTGVVGEYHLNWEATEILLGVYWRHYLHGW